MRKEWLLLAGIVTGALLLLLTIRWLAPGLLGIPTDIQLVETSKTRSPFYEGIFRAEDLQSSEFMLLDPRTRVRTRPLFPDILSMGPNDILGFRNRGVPDIADIIAIGDSQTYGNNAIFDQNWPSQMQDKLSEKGSSVYSMATGGWGAVQYLDMFLNATVFEPRVVIIAFYTGNDPLESFQMAYGVDYWAALKPDPSIDKTDNPSITFPAPESEWWPVTFKDGVQTVFTPTLRLGANQDHPAVNAGYAIMADVAKRISAAAEPFQLQLLFTIIPTKELVYGLKVMQDNLTPPQDYLTLLEREQHHIEQLSASLGNLPNAAYVDVVAPLQQAALGTTPLYPQGINGHPVANGYEVIADTLARKVNDYVTARPQGLVAIQHAADPIIFALVNDTGVWPFTSTEIMAANGWPPGDVPAIQMRDVAGLRWHRSVNSVDPGRFGPDSVVKDQQQDY